MRYWQSYRFIFTNSNGLINLTLGAVCLIIPMIGQIVLIGYCFEIVDALLRRRREQAGIPANLKGEGIMEALPANEEYHSGWYPDLNFNRFADYLARGIWPFLVQFIVNLVIGMVGGFFLMAGMMLAGFAAASADYPVMFFGLNGLFLFVYAFLMMTAGILTTPLYLRAGLSGDFSSAFSMEFYRDFMRRVGKEVVLAELFLMATGTLAAIVGFLLCYVGLFPAIALLMYARHHLEYQLYELYLDRGGVLVQRKAKSPSESEYYPDEEATTSHVIQPRLEERFTDTIRPEEE